MANILKKSVSLVAALSMLSTSVPAFAATSIVDGDLVKAAGNSAVYLVQGSNLRTFPYSTIYHSWGFPSNYSTVKTVSASDLAAYTIGDPIPFRDGSCFRGTAKSLPGFESEAVFCVSDGQLRPVESQNAFFGLFNVTNWTEGNKYVQFIPDDFLSKFDFAFGEKVTETEVNSGKLMNGLIVKGSIDGSYYLVQDGKLRALSTEAASANKFDLSKAVTVAQTKINSMTAALPVSTITETALVTPKTKAEAQNAGTVTEVAQASKVIVSADKASVDADGISVVNLTAKIVTANGALVSTATTPVTFVVTSGSATLSASSSTINGVATARLIPSTTASTITVTVYANGLTSGSTSIAALANSQAPQVVSVSNQGMQLVNVVFDRAVDKTSATALANYALKNDKTSQFIPTAAKLLDDNKTVQLKLGSNFYNNSTEDSIEIKNVKDASQRFTMSTVTKLFTVSDSTIPTVAAVESLGSKAIRVTFSEAVNGVEGYGTPATSYKAFRLDDKVLRYDASTDATKEIGYVTVTYPDAGDYTKALISFRDGISVGAHTLTVGSDAAITDYNVLSSSNTANPYTMAAAGYVVTVSADTNVPQLSSIEVVSQTKARYTFSKPVATPAADAFYWSTSANQLSGVAANSVEKVSDTTYDAIWSNAISTGSIYFYAGTTSYKVVDYSGNSVSPLPSSKLLTVNSDTAPSVVSISMIDTNKEESDKDITVAFNKEVDTTGSATNMSNYVIKKSNGTVLTSEDTEFVTSTGNPTGTFSLQNGNKEVLIHNNTYSIPGGSYLLCVTGVKASSGVYTSAMNEQCSSFEVSDKTAPELATNDAITASAKRIVIKFNEPMNIGTLLNAQNYKVTNVTGFEGEDAAKIASTRKLSDVSGVSLSAKNDNKDLVIDFSYDNAVTSSSTITVGYRETGSIHYITDAAGNYFADAVYSSGSTPAITFTNSKIFVGYGYGLVANGYGYGSGVASAKITSATTLEVVFDREIEQISASDFQISPNANTEWVSISNAVIDSTNKKKVTFTIPNTLGKVFKVTNTGYKLDQILRTGNINTSSKDTTGLSFIGMNVNNLNTSEQVTLNGSRVDVANDIKANLVAATLVNENTLLLSFDGKIAAAQDVELSKDLVITINGETWGYGKTAGSNLFYVDTTTASSNIKVVLMKSISLDSSIIVKTVSADALDTKGTTNAIIAVNTTGVTASSFAANSVKAADRHTTYGYGIEVKFTRNIDLASISTDTNFNVTSGYGYLFNRSMNYNVANDKLTINGIGEITGFGYGTPASFNGVFAYDADSKTLYVYTNSQDFVISNSLPLVFSPVSTLKSTSGTSISTSFLTEVK